MSVYLKHKKLVTNLATVLAMGIAVAGIIIFCIIPTYGEPVTLSKISYVSSPLKQFKSGAPLQNIQCNAGLELVIKTTGYSPACVKPSTATNLILSGRAKPLQSVHTGQDQSENKIITLTDNGKSINLRNGEKFLLKLGDNYNWNVEIDNQAVVSRVMNIMVVKGAQGVYEARSPGLATLTGIGDPLCHTAVPACMIPSIYFQLDVVVTL
jgi:hypothetical protein